MNNSYELLAGLKKLGFIKEERDRYWWPNSGSFEVVIGAVLTQQTKWEKVEKALENLRKKELLDLNKIAEVDITLLSTLIKPSGFYNTKAKRLKALCQAIIENYENFESFQENVTRNWLLSQKGLGFESADSILCYACYRDVLVVDSYTDRLLKAFGYEFEDYHDIQEWMMRGIEENLDKIIVLYGKEVNLFTIFSRLHGKVVEFCKENARGKNIDIGELKNG